MRAHAWYLWMLAAVLLNPAGAQAADSAAASAPAAKTQTPDDAADDELLEFLGSVDSEDEEWTDYLTETDPPLPKPEVKKDE